MLAEEFINQMIPPLKPNDSSQTALNWMEVFHLTQLAVVDERMFKGIIDEESILEKNNPNLPISEYPLSYKDVTVKSNSHYYDVINLASKNQLELMPVVGEANEYLGVISVNETSVAIAKMFASQGPGGIIVLAMKEIDYSLAQISRLIEANDTKILSVFVTDDSKKDSYIRVTLKLNRVDLTRVIATLERYDYKIIAQFQESDVENYDKDRLDMLFKYLNI
ncbi:CBS domain-containing protein [Cytophaga aurantiaca]|uniref:CBS domain-containing protein n=1 Tax=Cytophaga aurantiaca TaxID=29530 RepID=UPI0003792889|nr:CBS domain-containing protein [Cytophaga aurantiaca]